MIFQRIVLLSAFFLSGTFLASAQENPQTGGEEPSLHPPSFLVERAFSSEADPAGKQPHFSLEEVSTAQVRLNPLSVEDRAGTAAVRAGLGFTADPTLFLLSLQGDYFLKEDLSLGPLFQFGLSDDIFLFAPTANVQYKFDLPEKPPYDRIKPFLQGGLGLAYMQNSGGRTTVDEVAFLLNFGFGVEFLIDSQTSLGSNVLFNFIPTEVLGERFFFSWQVLSIRFHF